MESNPSMGSSPLTLSVRRICDNTAFEQQKLPVKWQNANAGSGTLLPLVRVISRLLDLL